jgi:hypothetical protein
MARSPARADKASSEDMGRQVLHQAQLDADRHTSANGQWHNAASSTVAAMMRFKDLKCSLLRLRWASTSAQPERAEAAVRKATRLLGQQDVAAYKGDDGKQVVAVSMPGRPSPVVLTSADESELEGYLCCLAAREEVCVCGGGGQGAGGRGGGEG